MGLGFISSKKETDQAMENAKRYIEKAKLLVSQIPADAINKVWYIDDSKQLRGGVVYAPDEEAAKAKYVLELAERGWDVHWSVLQVEVDEFKEDTTNGVLVFSHGRF